MRLVKSFFRARIAQLIYLSALTGGSLAVLVYLVAKFVATLFGPVVGFALTALGIVAVPVFSLVFAIIPTLLDIAARVLCLWLASDYLHKVIHVVPAFSLHQCTLLFAAYFLARMAVAGKIITITTTKKGDAPK